MTNLAVNSLLQNFGANAKSVIDRTHYSGPSSGGYHHHHHSHSSSKGGGGKHSIALTALTLLSFLFFLNILQQCLQDQMEMMNPTTVMPQVVIMQAQIREADKRKGDDEEIELVSNMSNDKELRNNNNEKNEVQQIPVKLKTSEKAYYRP